VVKDGPHCITWTHADQVNPELVAFLGRAAAQHGDSLPSQRSRCVIGYIRGPDAERTRVRPTACVAAEILPIRSPQ